MNTAFENSPEMHVQLPGGANMEVILAVNMKVSSYWPLDVTYEHCI